MQGKVAPMLPEAQARFNANTAELKSDRTISADPTFRCEPPGLPHIYGIGGYSIEIMQTPARILLFYESVHTFRTIWMDGRKRPEDADPLWMGFSVGHWDGNDLVVDTTGFNDKTWINGAGYPHSEALHLMARSGAQEFSDDKQREPSGSPLHRLNGIMLITSMIGVRGGPWNVDFAITRSPARRMSFRLLRALAEIRMGRIRAKL